MAHGVRKVNEFIVRDGRAITMTQDVAAGITQAQWDSIGDGTLYLNPINGNLKYKQRGSAIRNWTSFTPDNLFLPGSLSGNLIGNNTILEQHFANGSVSTRALANRSVTDIKIALEAVKNEHIKDDTLEGRAIKDNSLNGSKVKDNTLNGNKIENGSVAGTKLVQSTVTSRELAPLSVQTQHIADNAVTTTKIANANVTRAKVAAKAINNNLVDDNAIDSRTLMNEAVDNVNIARNAVRSRHILDGEVLSSKIADQGVITVKIADRNVTNAKLADKTITGDKIADGTITSNLLEVNMQTSLRNAVVHVGGVARVYGHLQVDNDIRSTSNNKTATITGFKVFNPVFADYAEGFVASEPVEVGDIVEIDRHTCVKKADSHSRKIVGVVSERYGMCLDADEEELASGAKIAVGLLGKVPVNVAGKVEAGDFIISSGDGIGIATKTFVPGAIVGKALDNKDTYGLGQVLCLINPM